MLKGRISFTKVRLLCEGRNGRWLSMKNKYKLMQEYEITISFGPYGATACVGSNGPSRPEYVTDPCEEIDDAISAAMAWLEDETQERVDEDYEPLGIADIT
jgi:hypothetical protein